MAIAIKEEFNFLDFHESLVHPLPQIDRGIMRNVKDGEIHGFVDLTQAKKWFSDYVLEELYKAGFKFVYRQVKEITAIGECQVLAIPYKYLPKNGRQICLYLNITVKKVLTQIGKNVVTNLKLLKQSE